MDPATLSLLFGIGSSAAGIFGAGSQDAAARESQRRQDRYNRKAWQMNKRSMKADFRYQKRGVNIARQNEETLGAFKDATNLQDWQYSLKIQDHEYRSQMRQFAKSEQIYGQQLSFNNMAAAAAREAEYRRLQDATNEIAFQNQDIVIKAMEAEGAAAVKGQQGRSANKSEQAVMASLGRNQAILAESLLSARGETQAALKKIASDKYGADIAAEAARMLQPERLPQPPKPLTTPRAIFQDPRRPRNFDFGPKPISGTVTSSLPGAIISGIGNIGTGIAGLANSGSKYNFSFGGESALKTSIGGWNL
jgi:hypothetical protein